MKKFTKRTRILTVVAIIALIPLLVTGCSISGGKNATPTPVATVTSLTQLRADVDALQTSFQAALTRLSSVETASSGVTSLQTRLTAVENTVGTMNLSSVQTCITSLQGQIAQLQADIALLTSRVNTIQTYLNGSTPTATPTATPVGATPTPTTGQGLVVTVTPLFSGAVKNAGVYSYTFSVKNNYTSAKTFKIIVDYLANTMSANIDTAGTGLTSPEVVSGFTALFSPSTGLGCGLIRFTSSNLVIPAGNTLNINAEFTLDYNAGSPTTVWSCGVTTQE